MSAFRRVAGLALLLSAAALALIACNGGEYGNGEATPVSPGEGGGGSGTAPSLSISQAQAADEEGPLLVRGYLVATDGEVRFCELLAESYPPQCAGDSLAVSGLELDSVDGLQQASGVRWTGGQIELLGHVEAGEIRVREVVDA